MAVVKVGGPAYRIGLGGGAASSRVSTAGTADLDFNAVQRGDAEMRRLCLSGVSPAVSRVPARMCDACFREQRVASLGFG